MKGKVSFFFAILLLIGNLLLFHSVLAYTTPIMHRPPIFTQKFSPLAANYDNKEIVISLSQENLTAYDGSNVFLKTPVTTGGPDTPTPMGTYHVFNKPQDFVMHSPWPPSDWRWYPDSFVTYGLEFQKGGYYIHDASWRSNFGPGSNTQAGAPGGSYTGTHGCVNVPYSAEAQLYAWTPIGTTVIVQE